VLNEGFDVEFGAIFDARIEQPPTYQEDWQFEWDITDHLGNLRIVYQDTDGDRNIDPSTEIIQDLGADKSALFNRFQYNSMDHVNEYGLDWNMTTYRSLQPDIGLWGQVDPKAELGYSMSPYCAMANNPILYNDPDGDWIHIAVGAVIGAGINVATHWDDITSDGFNWGEFGKAAGIGAVAGGITAATGGAAVGAGLAKQEI